MNKESTTMRQNFLYKSSPIKNKVAEMTYININPAMLITDGIHTANTEVLDMLKSKAIALKIHVFDSDPDNQKKPVLLFIHGNSSSKRVFDAQIADYQEKYRVITLDLPGHGQSTQLNAFAHLSDDEKDLLARAWYSLAAMVEAVAQVLQVKKVEGAQVVGWSLGGHIAYGLGIKYPELIASLVSIGSPPVKFSSEGLIAGFSVWFVKTLVPQWVEKPAYTALDEAISIREQMGFDQKDSFFIEDMMTTDPLVRRHLFLNIANYTQSKYDKSILDGKYFASSTLIPLCLIVGDKDAGINHQLIASFSGQFNNHFSSVHIIPQAQHAVFKTNPGKYHKIMDEFLDAISIKPNQSLSI